MIPILSNHDPKKIIGKYDGGVVTFKKGFMLPYKSLLQVFGRDGFKVVKAKDVKGVIFVSQFQIIKRPHSMIGNKL